MSIFTCTNEHFTTIMALNGTYCPGMTDESIAFELHTKEQWRKGAAVRIDVVDAPHIGEALRKVLGTVPEEDGCRVKYNRHPQGISLKDEIAKTSMDEPEMGNLRIPKRIVKGKVDCNIMDGKPRQCWADLIRNWRAQPLNPKNWRQWVRKFKARNKL